MPNEPNVPNLPNEILARLASLAHLAFLLNDLFVEFEMLLRDPVPGEGLRQLTRACADSRAQIRGSDQPLNCVSDCLRIIGGN